MLVARAFRHSAKDYEKPTGQAKVVRYGKLFLHHLAAERWQIENWISVASKGSPNRPWLLKQQELRSQIDEARRHVEALLPAFSWRPDQDPIRLIAARAQEAWEEANNGRAPRSTNPHGPLCRFLGPALTAIGQQRSPEAVGKVLRGRRRNPKGGQNR
jgi:hypothetical protein